MEPPKETVAAASCLLWLTLSGEAAAHPVGLQALLLTNLPNRKGNGKGAVPGHGGLKRRERRGAVHSLCSATNSLTRDGLLQGPQGLVHSSH